MKKKEFRKLKRLELVELIYQLRRDNPEWRKKCKELERQLRKAEKMALANASNANDERLERIESMLADIQRVKQLEIMLEREQAEPLEGMPRPVSDDDLFMLDGPDDEELPEGAADAEPEAAEEQPEAAEETEAASDAEPEAGEEAPEAADGIQDEPADEAEEPESIPE